MDIHSVFAGNLREACNRYGSVASVCRGTGINRQQFNRYLSGKNIPNPKTLAKIAEFLGVEETGLFAVTVGEAKRPGRGKGKNSDISAQLQHLATSFSQLSDAKPATLVGALKEGFYKCIFPLQGFPQFAVKAVMKVTYSDGISQITRHTAFKLPSSANKKQFFGKHRGVAIATAEELHLIGFNTISTRHLSFFSFEREPNPGTNVLVGFSQTRTVGNLYASIICMEYVGKSMSNAKAAMRDLGIVPVESESLGAVSRILADRSTAEAQQLALPRLENIFLMPDALPDKKLRA